eukprot:GHRQ01035392.1.p1 GENE.GHRQ01035392.1~~GHRQ01035392.1.p1  ORF type:complete len:211 (+),score=94.99 GHRQ01035392.1:452-1084(+)
MSFVVPVLFHLGWGGHVHISVVVPCSGWDSRRLPACLPGVLAVLLACSPVMQRQLTYCMEHPEEISKMASVQRKVDEVKGVMLQNVEQVLVRGERLDVLVDRTDDLRDQAARFQKQGTQLRKRMWWQNFRVKLIVIGVVVLLVVVIFLLACFTNGRNCVKTGSSNGGSPYAAAPPPVGSSNGAVLPNTPSALVPGPPNLAPATPAGSGSG